jgi:hypothetical protein
VIFLPHCLHALPSGRNVGHARARGSVSLRSFIPAVDFRAGSIQQ